MTSFADLAAGGRRLLSAVVDAGIDLRGGVVVAIVPNGVPVAEPVADGLGLPLVGAHLDREGEPRVTDVPEVVGRTVIVVDDGVETGTAAWLVGTALRSAGAARIVLAVPVCPRQAEAGLITLYDEIVSIDRPLARRDLRWHYVDFDTIDGAEARRRLGAR
ncbi:MAG: phosphoribosyltransferase family protein [Actinomycetota bacterium]